MDGTWPIAFQLSSARWVNSPCTASNLLGTIKSLFDKHIKVAKASSATFSSDFESAFTFVSNCFKCRNKILLFGNGGSAADAQHIAAEFVGRFLKERKSLPAIALTTDSSALTSIGNDYGFDRIFERQLQGLAAPGDVLIGISTSGNSPNVIKALSFGRNVGCITIGLSSSNGGKMKAYCNLNLIVPSAVTARVQEMHILIGHIICSVADSMFD